METPKDLSDYDEKLIKEIKESKLLIIDLDGTLIDFEKIDNVIIKRIFPDSRIIDSIDNILWKINRLDIFGNGYVGLKIRLAVYSIFSEYDLKECKKLYGTLYEKYARLEFMSIYSTTLKQMLNSGYKVAIVTKNVYARDILKKYINVIGANSLNNLQLIILKRDKKKKQFKELIKKYDRKVCVIGNNLSDDIINSYKIGSPFIYIGKSKAMNYILKLKFMHKRGVQFKSFKQLKTIFIKEEK